MQDVSKIDARESHLFLDTGSPHHIQMVEDITQLNVKKEGSSIRHSHLYGAAGSNINFVQTLDRGFRVRTYERGVEDETLSCGTGVTAVALAMHYSGKTQDHEVKLSTEGGELKVRFKEKNQSYFDIWLIGPATQVYKGQVVI
jgi:diaminopimelate epimerase